MRRLTGALALAAAVALPAAGRSPPGVDMTAVLAEEPAPTLAAYRLFTDPGATRPNARVTPYSLQTPLFSDYAEKHRYAFIPPGKSAAWRDQGAPDLPVGTVLVKTFAYRADPGAPGDGERFLETRLLIHKPSGWVALPYVWNAERTEAVLKRAGTRIDVAFQDPRGKPRRLDYLVPNVNQCKECHALAGKLEPIGVKGRNLNSEFDYAAGPENQLAHWARTGLLTGAPTPSAAPRTARWDDPSEPLAARARAYIDANCAHCHNPQGMASNSGLYLQLEETRPSALGVGKAPVAAGRGSGGLAVAIEPGRPEASILVYRMASDDPGVMMPELGRTLVHEEGVDLVRAFVAGMKP
jgi:uncharacterized repeat protein (TIGR03806 family)